MKDFSVSVHLQDSTGNMWWFSGVYNPHQDGSKRVFFEELREVRSSCWGPRIVAGDFNQIFIVEDKNNTNINRSMLRHFRRLVNDLELKKIYLLCRRFNWSNEREEPMLVKLDYVFCSSWVDLFPDCTLRSNASYLSDHCPPSLILNEEIRGNKKVSF